MTVMTLVEDGVLELDRPVVVYLPDLALPDGGSVMLRRLQSHPSGLSPDPDVPAYAVVP